MKSIGGSWTTAQEGFSNYQQRKDMTRDNNLGVLTEGPRYDLDTKTRGERGTTDACFYGGLR